MMIFKDVADATENGNYSCFGSVAMNCRMGLMGVLECTRNT